MSQTLRLSTLVMLGASGLFAGAALWYAWERVWIWRRLSLADYAVDFRRSLRKADPAMPILLVTCGIAAGAFASLTSSTARTLAIAGIGLLVTILVGSIVLAEPVNSQFRRRPEGVVPPDAERLRGFWRRFHLVRTALAIAAFVIFITAVSYV
jgi:anthrone oxygenase-like protein